MGSPNVIVRMRYVGNKQDIAKIRDESKRELYNNYRKFYSCGGGGNYVDYIKTGVAESEKLDYVDYSGNKEKSEGIFSKNGLLDKTATKQLKQNLRTTQSPIWDGIISFEESFGKNYCADFTAAYELMKVELPKLFKANNMNIGNVAWYAGLHTNKQHHNHIHFSFYELEPLRRSYNGEKAYSKGKIPTETLALFKANIQSNLTGLSSQLRRDRIALRDSLNNFSIKENTTKELNKILKELAEKIPLSGSLGYVSENMTCIRPLVDKAVELIISANPKLKANLQAIRERLLGNSAKLNLFDSKKKIEFTDSFDSFKKDMYRRIGNKIISFVVETRCKYPSEQPIVMKSPKYGKKRYRKKVSELDKYLKKMSYYANLDQVAIDEFFRYLAKLEKMRKENEKQEDESDMEM